MSYLAKRYRSPVNRRHLRSVPAGMGDIPGAFQATTEAWRDLVTSMAGDLPIGFLMAWIDRESAGDPCSYTSAGEAGIFQLLPPDNMAAGNTTPAQQHPVPPCIANAQSVIGLSQLTSDQANAQVQGGIDYINNYARARAHALLDAAGYTDGWTENDASFWQMVKLNHALPAPIAGTLANAVNVLGSVPPDWATWRSTVTTIPAKELDNAEQVGAYGAGGGSVFSSLTSPASLLVIGGALLLFAYLWRRDNAASRTHAV